MTNPYIVPNIYFSTGVHAAAADAGRVYYDDVPLPNEMSLEEHAVYYFPNEIQTIERFTEIQRTRGMNENFVDFLVRHNFRKNIAMEISKKMNEEPSTVKIVEDFRSKDSDVIATLMDDLIAESLVVAEEWVRSDMSIFPPPWVKILHKEHLLKLWESTQGVHAAAADAGRVYIPLPNEMSPKEHAKYYFPNEMTSDQRTRGMNENFVDFLVRHNFRKNIAMEISKKMNEEQWTMKIVEDFWFKDSDVIATLMDDLIVESLVVAEEWVRSDKSIFQPPWVKILHKEHLLKLWESTQHKLRHSWRDQ